MSEGTRIDLCDCQYGRGLMVMGVARHKSRGPCNRWFRNLRRELPRGLGILPVSHRISGKAILSSTGTPSAGPRLEVPPPRLWAPPHGPLPSPLQRGLPALAGKTELSMQAALLLVLHF